MDDYLQHYGVLGMKWGVRRYQNKDGSLTKAGKKRVAKREARGSYAMTKREVKKAIKNIRKGAPSDNYDKVKKEYDNEFRSNKKYNQLGKQSTDIANKILKIEEEYIDKDYPYEKTRPLYKKMEDINKQMTKIDIEVGNKYVDKFNDARLKDINYQGSVDKGKAMLKAYGKNYTVRYDGYIEDGLLGGVWIDYGYIRPYNL